ncbi:hypothetical protein RDWZM_009403 [Blomia tropicalis]|uniref:Eukaryotic translation initiation factor 5 n=1 Tax=Blomia tropicalis TaxID=40697 RepID=A0A9Q0RM97_BLOTA|nr:Eukaryotic translation initiation factor 5A-1 [Blomia tropicalis]KAJ6218246.1 hypothetical protein RDWZM_009403 [Blomia tropicalis]
MASVNVNRNLSDQFYRYKMPKLIAKVEGKGNGIKTVIVNMVEIAKALNRPPMYPTKYFGCILGAQVNCDVKNERYIVNGSHESGKLQDLLDGFIKKYVLCASCENPETVLTVNKKKETISSSCKACGYSCNISMKDKLSTYILKCPPDMSMAPGASVSKKVKKKDKKAENGRGSPNDSDELNDHGFEQNEEEDDGDWCEPSAQLDDTGSALQKLTLNADLEKSVDERMELFFEFTKKRLEGDVVDASVQKEIVDESERLDVKDKAVLVLCELLFKDPLKIPNIIKANRIFFLRFTNENPKAQKYLIRGFEMTIKVYQAALLPRVAIILKTFYELDILDEKVILEWASKKKSAAKQLAAQIHEKAQPFIKWLKEAESESDSESEEEDEVEVVYDERSRPDKIMEVKEDPIASPKMVMATAAVKVGGGDDDIDIDAI